MTTHVGNLFELAEKQLQYEKQKGLRQQYQLIDVLDYAIEIRKQLDKYGKKGEIIRAKNIHSNKLIELENKKDMRRRKYIRTGR